MTRRLFAAVAGLAAAAALALLPAASASAHDYLVSSDPAADATVTAPQSTVTLTFNDRVLDYGSNTRLEVTDAAKQHFETGCATVADRTVSAPLALGAAGQYTVTYQIVSADGHTVSESYAFQYQPPAGTPEAAGSPTTPCGAPPASGPASPGTSETPAAGEPGGTMTTQATASTPQPVQTAGSTDLRLVIGIAVAIVVLAIAGVVILLITARRRPPAPPA
jgi:methionine-rich copper-binding protein CopC